MITYKISYVLNGGVNDAENPTTYTIEDKIDLKPATKTGYTLKWSDNGVIEKGSTGGKTFTANWQVITYKISYLLNGGVNNADNPTTYTVEDKVELKPATKTGYTFTSWDNNGVIEKGSTGNKFFSANFTADVKLSSDGTTVTGLNNAVSDLVILSEYDGVKVTSIGDSAFSGCTSLTSSTIPDSVTSIGYDAFSGCSSLAKIYYNGDINGWVQIDGLNYLMRYGSSNKELYINGKLLTKAVIDKATEIKRSAFCNCSSLTSVTIGNGVTSIGDNAFEDCSSLTSVTIGNGVTSIGAWAFENCTSLTSITIPDGVTSIGGCTFEYCTSLTSVTIGDGVTRIGNYAFDGCTSLTSVTIPDSVTRIGDYAFSYCTSLTSITVNANNKNYKSINGNLYSKDGKTLIQYAIGKTDTSFSIPDSVTSIGDRAFYDCSLLTSVTIPDGVTRIGNYAFDGCTSLTSITIGNGVTSIGDRAFYDCSSLTSVTIPYSVTSIGRSAFFRCLKLIEVINNSSLNIKKGSNDYGYVAYYALSVKKGGESDIKNQGEYQFITLDGVNYLVNYVGTDTEITLPANYNGQKYVINDYAFYNCTSLTSITIGNSVTCIGDYAFGGCSSLENITVGSKVTSIGDYAFYSCSLTSITIPDSVTSIGECVFWGCTSLTSITIPDSVTSIGDYVFLYCRSLKNINYKGSKKQWDAISKGPHWNYGSGYCTINYNYVEK